MLRGSRYPRPCLRLKLTNIDQQLFEHEESVKKLKLIIGKGRI